jgi:hypothetical protein
VAHLWLEASHPHITSSQRRVLNKLFDAQPGGFAGDLSTEKYVAITSLSRATADRELTQLLATGLLVKTGQGKATRYALPSNPWVSLYRLSKISSAMPPNIAVEASSMVSVRLSPNSATPPSAAMTGTLSCAVAAWVALRAGRAWYHSA